MNSEFYISVATTTDAPEIMALVNSAYRGDSARTGWTHEADLLGGTRIELLELIAEIENPKKNILCLRKEKSGPILGTVCLEWVNDIPEKGPGAYLGMLTTQPELQAQGLGKALLKAVESFVKDHGYFHIILGVIHTRAELIAWYQRRGYQKISLTKPFPYDHPGIKNPTRLDLYFEFFVKDLS